MCPARSAARSCRCSGLHDEGQGPLKSWDYRSEAGLMEARINNRGPMNRHRVDA